MSYLVWGLGTEQFQEQEQPTLLTAEPALHPEASSLEERTWDLSLEVCAGAYQTKSRGHGTSSGINSRSQIRDRRKQTIQASKDTDQPNLGGEKEASLFAFRCSVGQVRTCPG